MRKSSFDSFGAVNDGNTTIMSEYGHSPFNFPEDYTYYYQGDILNIPYSFYGGSVDSEVGLLIFIDGIAQPYTVKDSEGAVYDYMTIFNVDANSEMVYMLNIIPTHGKANDNLKLNFVCVDFPSFDRLDKTTIDLQSMSTTISWKLRYLEDAFKSMQLSNKEPRAKSISMITEKDYDEDHEFNIVLEESDIIVDDTSKTLKFIVNVGEDEGYYRTTIFINNIPSIIDDGNNFIEHKMNKDERLIYEFEIDDESLTEIKVIYAISIKLNNNMDTDQPQIDVFKTNSILFNASVS